MTGTYDEYLARGMQAGLRYRLAPPRHIPQGLMGEQLGNRPGSSLEFMDHRDYLPGDDLRRIDWSAYARSDKLTVRLYREEINPHLDIILDGSMSMALSGTEKPGSSVAIAAMMAQAAANAGFSYKLWLASDYCIDLPGGSGLPTHWQGIQFNYRGSPVDSLSHPTGRMRSRAMRLLISDLLWAGDPMQPMLQLSRDASSVFVIQVLATVDIEPPGPGNLRLLDSETGQLLEVYIDTAARQQYLDRLARHQQLWQQACQHCGAAMTVVTAESYLQTFELKDFIVNGIIQ